MAAVVTVIRDFDNPLARAILDDKSRLSGNRRLVADAYKAGEVREASAWKSALAENSPDAFSAYIAAFPSGHYVAEAVTRRDALLEEQAWQTARQQNTTASYKLYLSSYSTGSRAGAAQAEIQRLSAMASRGQFALEAVGETARPAVVAARQIAGNAVEAQRQARAGRSGFFSQYRDPESGWVMKNQFRGMFEGRIGRFKAPLGNKVEYAELGIWKFTQHTEGMGQSSRLVIPDVVEAKAQSVSHSTWGGFRFAGELSFSDGRKFEGEFVPGGDAFLPDGLGALWASDGTLIGEGRWKKGKMEK